MSPLGAKILPRSKAFSCLFLLLFLLLLCFLVAVCAGRSCATSAVDFIFVLLALVIFLYLNSLPSLPLPLPAFFLLPLAFLPKPTSAASIVRQINSGAFAVVGCAFFLCGAFLAFPGRVLEAWQYFFCVKVAAVCVG